MTVHKINVQDIIRNAKGPVGLTGPKGNIGSEGIQGPVGPQGDKGDKGDTGLQGKPGTEGLRGSDGKDGMPGLQGEAGTLGPMGPIPGHQWQGTAIRFQTNDEEWGKFVNLQGPQAQGGGGGAPMGSNKKQVFKTVTVPETTATEDITLGFISEGAKLAEIDVVVRGTTPSVDWTVRFDSDRSASGTEVITSGTTTTSETGDIISAFTQGNIPKESWLWLETSATSGTVTEFSLTLYIK